MESASAIMPARPETSTMCGATAAPSTPATSPKLAVRPSLKPYTTLRRKPPEPVRCQGSLARPASFASVSACAADSLARVSDTLRASSVLACRCRSM